MYIDNVLSYRAEQCCIFFLQIQRFFKDSFSAILAYLARHRVYGIQSANERVNCTLVHDFIAYSSKYIQSDFLKIMISTKIPFVKNIQHIFFVFFFC